MAPRSRARLTFEPLEAREVPSATQTFDLVASPALPAGWAEWSSDGTDAFRTAAGQGVGGSTAVQLLGTSRTAGVAWSTQAVTPNTGAAASVRVNSLVPAFVLARGSNLDGASPSYLAAVVTRGLRVELWEVTGGAVKVLAAVQSPASAWFSGGWARVTLVPTGSAVTVQVTRPDTGQFLTPGGTWQAAPATAITATTALTAGGLVGFGRAARHSGTVSVDDFVALTPSVAERFDAAPAAGLPAGWSGWSSDAAGRFQVSAARALSPANGLASAGGSRSAARAWADAVLPADSDASAALYVDGLVPATLFVRGSNLDTAAPTYYGVTVVRGLEARLVKVVDGVESTVATARSASYFSGQWARVRLVAQGDRLQLLVSRADTGEWLGSDGRWAETPDFALDVRDGSIPGGGRAGVARGARFAGTVTFDDFAAGVANTADAPAVAIQPLASPTVRDEVTFRATVTGTPTRVEFRLNGQVRATAAAGPASWVFDSTAVPNGAYTLTVRAFDAAGNIGTADYAFTVANPNADPVPKPAIPRKYDHIRIAQLAYSGNPMGAFERELLRTSVDLVIPNTRYLSTVQGVSPDTPQLIYSNVSNLYQGLLTDWLAYADRTGVARGEAFYHVTRATPFSGASPSSQPVTWFWGAYQTPPGGPTADVTAAIRGGRSFNVSPGGVGQTTAIGYVERFRELTVALARAADAGWGGVWEYVAAVDAAGAPAEWKTLRVGQDGTGGFRQNGQVVFDPPADWVAASVGGSARLFYVRFRTTDGTAAQAPQFATVFGRDYVNARGATAGTIPAFDAAADRDGDGYLNDAEYAARKPGMDARFEYESRLFYPFYGQMRFVTNPAPGAVRRWAADYHVRLLQSNPLADGIMMDNAHGKLPFPGVSVREPTATFSSDSGALVAAVNRAIAPRWVLSNTAGGRAEGNAIAAGSGGAFEEFLLRPLQANWSEVGDVADLVAGRLGADGRPYLVLDSFPAGGSPTDPRTLLGTLSYYYLVADPDRTFLMFFGGSNPSSSWTEHWTPAAAVNVGRPTGAMRTFAAGADPLSPSLSYRVFALDYENALVLYKPLSYAAGVGEGTTNPQTATTHPLGGTYRPVNADGTLGPAVTAVTLRNGEGAVLVRA